MTPDLLRRIAPEDMPELRRDPVAPETLAEAGAIIRDVREGGLAALRRQAERLGDLTPASPLFMGPEAMHAALERIPASSREVLERTAQRIAAFARAQRDSLQDMQLAIPGGFAGHDVTPVERAGCYAPGGRFPLPSSVLMTAVTARVAGVPSVVVASPRPTDETLAAAAIAGAEAVLCVGGAQAIAAMAYGVGLEACDAIVGPGNRWVTAAKQLVSGRVRIDMLAGPSELVVIADASAQAATVAADLLAQAEHDTDALPVLITTSLALADAVQIELQRQLATLPTAETARAALQNGFVVLAESLEHAASLSNRLAPEHLELLVENPSALAPRLKHYGGLFIGEGSAEVLGDYGAGPNHTLPTGGTARWKGGLSVLDFLRVQTWMRVDDLQEARELVADARDLGRMEGLEAHARSAELRKR